MDNVPFVLLFISIRYSDYYHPKNYLPGRERSAHFIRNVYGFNSVLRPMQMSQKAHKKVPHCDILRDSNWK